MKYYRLKKQADFQKIFTKGKRAFSPSMTVLYRKSDKLTFGISVGKRHGKAVQRNRIKRLLREAFRKNANKINGTYSFVIVPKVLDEYSLKTFEKHLQWIIEKEKM